MDAEVTKLANKTRGPRLLTRGFNSLQIKSPGMAATAEIVEIENLTPAQFLAAHAAPGRVGLAGGKELVSRLIRRAQRFMRPDLKPSLWSHAFLVSEARSDGRLWVIESDLDIDPRHKTVRLGVQENRIEKYHDSDQHAHLAILDFGLDAKQADAVIVEGLNLLAGHTVYSLRELVGTLFAMTRPGLRARENLMAREGALYCSAMVHHCFQAAGIRLLRAHEKNTTPDDLMRSPRLKRAWILRGREPKLDSGVAARPRRSK